MPSQSSQGDADHADKLASPPASPMASDDVDDEEHVHEIPAVAEQSEADQVVSNEARETSSTTSSASCFTLFKNAIRNSDQLTAMISNYSTSYNAVNVGIVLPILKYSMELSAAATAATTTTAASDLNNHNYGNNGESTFNSSFADHIPLNFDDTFDFSYQDLSSMQLLASMVITPMKQLSTGIAQQILNLLYHYFPMNIKPHSLLANNNYSLRKFSQYTRQLDGSYNDATNGGEEEEEQDSIVASSLLAGMIVGQLIGGYLGDVLGRRNAMLLVMILQIVGSLGGALFISTDVASSGDGYENDGYYNGDQGGYSGYDTNDDGNGGGMTALEQLALWRFLLGIGAGGVYPLAAVMSAENKGDDEEEVDNKHAGQLVGQEDNALVDEEDDTLNRRLDGNNHRHNEYVQASANELTPSPPRRPQQSSNGDTSSFQRIALTFSTQGLGFLTVPLLAYPMLEMRWDIDLIWRVLLGVGAIPGFWVLYLRLCRSGNVYHRSKETEASTENEVSNSLDDAFDYEDEDEDIDCAVNGDQSTTKNTMMNNTGSTESRGSLELTSHDDGGGVEDPSLQSAVSGLFSSDLMSSEGEPPKDNELPLVENSHLESGGSGDVSEEPTPVQMTKTKSPGLWASIKNEPNLLKKFAGTAGTWFLFDVLFYGNTLFEPLVLEAAFGTDPEEANGDGYSLLQTTVRDSLIVSLISLPGYFVTVLLIGQRTCACRSIRSSTSPSRCGSAACCFPCYQSPTYIQCQGFLLMFLLYFIIGMCWTQLSEIQWLLLLLYGGTFFFANYGPNTTTFLLPSVTYSEECRSTLNGLSAAAGKMGALVGASVFAPAADKWGESAVMVFCAFVSVVAFGLTKICVGGSGQQLYKK